MGLNKETDANLIAKMVLDVNRVGHDLCAKDHDRAVPYIHRQSTRRYYWDLLSAGISSVGKQWHGSRVLELGCGTGTFADMVVASGATYIGLDLSPRMIEVARGKFENPKMFFQCSSLEAFAPSNHGIADIIFSFSFLHHLSDLEAGLVSISSMLAEQGFYVALHEVNSMRKLSFWEKIDERLQCLFGYGPFVSKPFWKRVLWALQVRSILKMLVRLGGSATIESTVDYIDYQLNKPFSLSNRVGHLGKVSQYCYFAFPELMKFSRPMNHEMLVMGKSMSRVQV